MKPILDVACGSKMFYWWIFMKGEVDDYKNKNNKK